MCYLSTLLPYAPSNGQTYHLMSYARIPSGLPEGLFVAFANIHKEFLNAVEAKKQGKDYSCFDFPTISDGVNGVKFIHAVVDSADGGSQWVTIK